MDQADSVHSTPRTNTSKSKSTRPSTRRGGVSSPGAACSRDPQHCFNEQPVIASATPRITGFAHTMRLHLLPLGVCQNESIHQKLESHQASKGNPNSQQTLGRHRREHNVELRTLVLSPALTRAWELTSSSMRTSFRSVSGRQFSVMSRSPGKICHFDPSSSSTRWL